MAKRMDVERYVDQRFGMLVVVAGAPTQRGSTQAVFHCDCGSRVTKPLAQVVSGHTKSCGCLRKRSPRACPPEKMLNRRFGRLVVVKEAPRKNKQTHWVCRCECGGAKTVSLNNLKNGSTQSCGCLALESARVMGRKGKGVRARNWQGIGDISASFWGQVLAGASSRGLEVAVTHQDIWNLFRTQGGKCALTGWALRFDPPGGRGKGTASLDRIDSSKGYVRGNLQWVHKRIQRMKWKFTQDEFLEACVAVSEKASSDTKGHLVSA